MFIILRLGRTRPQRLRTFIRNDNEKLPLFLLSVDCLARISTKIPSKSALRLCSLACPPTAPLALLPRLYRLEISAKTVGIISVQVETFLTSDNIYSK